MERVPLPVAQQAARSFIDFGIGPKPDVSSRFWCAQQTDATGHKETSADLLDHLVRAAEYGLGDGETERLGGG